LSARRNASRRNLQQPADDAVENARHGDLAVGPGRDRAVVDVRGAVQSPKQVQSAAATAQKEDDDRQPEPVSRLEREQKRLRGVDGVADVVECVEGHAPNCTTPMRKIFEP